MKWSCENLHEKLDAKDARKSCMEKLHENFVRKKLYEKIARKSCTKKVAWKVAWGNAKLHAEIIKKFCKKKKVLQRKFFVRK